MFIISTSVTQKSTRDIKEGCGPVILIEIFQKTKTNYNNPYGKVFKSQNLDKYQIKKW